MNLSPAEYGFLGMIFGALIAFLSSVFSTYINNLTNFKLYEKKEKFEIAKASYEFQREILIAIQDEITGVYRYTSKIFVTLLIEFQISQKWDVRKSKKEDDTSLMQHKRTLETLKGRVFNDDLQKAIAEFQGLMDKPIGFKMNSTKEKEEYIFTERSKGLEEFNNKYEEVMKLITDELKFQFGYI